MSTTATLIPTFATITLIAGGFTELSVQLTLAGIFAIFLHAAITPSDLYGLYPNLDNPYPTYPPFRDYVLVFGLASLVLLALFSRIYPLIRFLVLGQPVPKVEDTRADLKPNHTSRTPSPSHTFVGDWNATTSTLAVGSPTPTDPSETVALKLRVSQLEAALEEVRCRLDTLATGGQGTDMTPGVGATVFTKPLLTHTLAPPSNLETFLSPPTQPLSPPPSPTDPNRNPSIGLKPADATTDARERLRSLVALMAEGTRQTDKLIHKMRNVLKADATSDTAFEAREDKDDAPPVPPTPSSTQIIPSELPPPSPTATPPIQCPRPPPLPSPFNHSDQPLRAPTIRKVKITSPLPPAAKRVNETAVGSPRAPRFNLTLNFLDLSRAPCSTPLRSTEKAEESTSPPPSLRVLETDLSRRALFPAPAPKHVSKTNTIAYQTSREPSNHMKIALQDSTPRHKHELISRIHEHSSKALYRPPPSVLAESSLDARRNVKGKSTAARARQDTLDWLAERRRMRGIQPKPRLSR